MKTKKIIALACSAGLALTLLLTGCTATDTMGTATTETASTEASATEQTTTDAPPDMPTDGTPPDGTGGGPPPDGEPGGFGGSGAVTNGTAANTIDTDGTITGETYTSTGDES